MNPGQWTTPGQSLPRGKCYLTFTWFVVPGQGCPGSTLLVRGKFMVIQSLWIYLNSFSFYTDCYREWILNRFTYFWCFLELFIEKFIPNINNEHAQDYSYPGATFAFGSHGEKLPRQGGLPGVVQRVTRLSKLPRGNQNSCEQLQASDHAPRQSWPRDKWELPWGNELSRDHVNRP